MKLIKLLSGVTFLTLTAFANAADIVSHPLLLSQETDGSIDGIFYHQFDKKASGKSFLDIYDFTITSADVGATFSSSASFGGKGSLDLSFTSFNLYANGGINPLVTGKLVADGNSDNGLFKRLLPAGTYSLQIAGMVLGSNGGSYSGTLSVSPVPEPETWAMSLSGLAAVGFLAARRRAKPFRN